MARALPWAHDETEFVSDLQAGSELAFDLLVTHYHAPVYSLLYSMVGDAADAADATQEVFLKAFRGIRGFRRGSSLKTWLYRIAVREALNQRRWWWRHRRQELSLDAEREDGQPALELEGEEASPFEQMASREVQQAVHEALRRVPAVFRTAVILRDLEGFSYDEVAEVLDVSVGTVKSRILRGRAALRELLAPWLEQQQRHGESCSGAAAGAGAGGGALATGFSSALGMFAELGGDPARGGGE
jgi:RNA polymerase sigma-70 factor (ECF subfamily)